MSSQTLLGSSPQVLDNNHRKTAVVPLVSPKPSFELIDAAELARRLGGLPVSWVRSRTRGRSLDEIPHLKLGRYIRFDWNSPELQRWIREHQEGR